MLFMLELFTLVPHLVNRLGWCSTLDRNTSQLLVPFVTIMLLKITILKFMMVLPMTLLARKWRIDVLPNPMTCTNLKPPKSCPEALPSLLTDLLNSRASSGRTPLVYRSLVELMLVLKELLRCQSRR